LNRIDINTAKASDLADFGVAKGLEVNYRMGAEKLIAALRTAGWTEDWIEVGAERPKEMAATAPEVLDSMASFATKATIELEGDYPLNYPQGQGEKGVRVAYGVNNAHPETGAFDSLVTLVIPAEKGEGGDRPVKVGVNGKAMVLPRRRRISIPFRYYECLLHAVRKQYDPHPEGYGLMPARPVPAYGFNVISGAPQPEQELA
jgi:hypothetical protein